jgi:uncharacterized protein
MSPITTTSPSSVRPAPRDEAIDVARAVAILGMFVIHAVLVLAVSYPRTGTAAFLLWLCDGRAAATFVTLAGFGVARLAAKDARVVATQTLHRRALALWVLGVLNLIIWPGDILRVYGVALLAAPMMLRWSVRTRLRVSVALVALFVLGMLLLDWTRHWEISTLTYVGVWTVEGFVRNLLFDGFRPVVPWLAFFLWGTILAELDLHDLTLQRRMIRLGALAIVTAVVASVGLDRLLVQFAPQLDALTREGLVGTTSLPPLPLFMLSAVGSTAVLLGAVLRLAPIAPRGVVTMLSATGRRALTWYVLHVMVLVALHVGGAGHSLSTAWAISAGVALFAGAALWSWRHADSHGTLETLMRRVSRAGVVRPMRVDHTERRAEERPTLDAGAA